MGFDIECIIDIHTYPGEYFCPVCRTLVYPNEAFQAQCTHLYCKPCLAHVANGSRACPYDGYLVTEVDSKPLKETDKALVESIGKVKVHCLYFRSGCTWEGALSDCTSHCSGCSFGNSPVICNRCGVQIVHREVHDHAQSCPGVAEGQQAVGSGAGISKAATSSSTATAEVNQTVAQSGAPLPQAQNPQNVTATPAPGQNHNQQGNASSQAAPPPVPTPEQWYQQQYQQYYQQYGAYDAQQYYTLQQQQFQQYQQQPMQVQGQHQSHVYSQGQQHPQPQPNPVPLVQQQPHLQPQAQGQFQSQSQPQLQQAPQAQPQLQVPPQGNAPIQTLAPMYQQQSHPPMRPQSQIPPQTLPPPPPSHYTQQQPFPHAVGMRPPTQHPQGPQYQQTHGQMHHPQTPQAHVQAQMHPQPHLQPHTQSTNQSHMQVQPQTQPYHTQSQHPMFAPHANHSIAPAALPQASHPPGPPVSGHHSHQQSQPTQKMQSGTSQQPPVHPHPASGSLHPQPPVMRPPHPQQQPSVLLPAQNQTHNILPAQHQQFPPYAQQPTHPPQNRPFMQPVQQAPPQHYAQHQQFVAPFQSQSHQQGYPLPQQLMQPHMRPSGPPQPQQSQNYVGRPVMPSHGLQSQSNPLSAGGGGPHGPSGTAQLTLLEQNPTLQENRSPSKGLPAKGIEGEFTKEAVAGQNGTVVKDADSAAGDGLVKSVIKQEGDDVPGGLEQASGGKSFEAGKAEDGFNKDGGRSLAVSESLKQGDLENQQMQLSRPAVVGSSAIFDKQSHTPPNTVLQPKSHGSHNQRLQEQAQGQSSAMVGPQGPGLLPYPSQSLNPIDGRMPGNFGPPLNDFESQTSLADPRGIIGRAPPLRPEGHYGMNGGTNPDSSMFSRDEKLKTLSWEHSDPFPVAPGRMDQAAKSLDKAPNMPNYDTVSKLDPSALGPHSRLFPHHPSGGHAPVDTFAPGSEFGNHHMKHFANRSPDREYFGSSPRGFGGPSGFPRDSSAMDDINSREALRFGEGSRPFNISADPTGNPFHDGRFPSIPGHARRGDIGGSGNPRFGEHMAPGPLHNQIGDDDLFGTDRPGHLMRGKFSSPGYLPGQFNMSDTGGPGVFRGPGRVGELGGPGNFPRLPFTESVRGDRSSFPQFGEPAMRNNFSLPSYPNAGNFAVGLNPFDQPRRRKLTSTGWCRICEIDCETVEGLDMHSQTRAHQNMAIDMVKRIKLQNKKKQRTSAGHAVREGGNRGRKVGNFGRGGKP